MPGFRSRDVWSRVEPAWEPAEPPPTRPRRAPEVAAERRDALSVAYVPRARQTPQSFSPPLQGPGTPRGERAPGSGDFSPRPFA